MEGTVVNIVAIVVGSLIGRYLGRFVPEKIRGTVMIGVGLAVVMIGLQMGLKSRQPLVIIGSLAIGGIIGQAVGIEEWLEKVGGRLQAKMAGAGDVAEAFMVASLLYCVGAMAVMGSIQDGLGDRPDILYAKSALDGLASVALASTLGIGVLFSIIPVGLYQGAITLAAGSVKVFLTDPVVREMNAVGGLLILGIGLDLLGIKRLPVGNLLPGLFVAALLMAVSGLG